MVAETDVKAVRSWLLKQAHLPHTIGKAVVFCNCVQISKAVVFCSCGCVVTLLPTFVLHANQQPPGDFLETMYNIHCLFSSRDSGDCVQYAYATYIVV